MEEQKERQALRALIAGVSPGRENALVFGEGPKNPKLMLIGEAPGEQESLMGRPFVGKAGKNLDHFLALVGLVRGERIGRDEEVEIPLDPRALHGGAGVLAAQRRRRGDPALKI